MSFFQKKPVVIDAMHFHGTDEDLKKVHDWARQFGDVCLDLENSSMSIKTLEGVMTVSYGDWVIKGVMGEMYPCKPDIFHATYSPLSPSSGSCCGSH